MDSDSGSITKILNEQSCDVLPGDDDNNNNNNKKLIDSSDLASSSTTAAASSSSSSFSSTNDNESTTATENLTKAFQNVSLVDDDTKDTAKQDNNKVDSAKKPKPIKLPPGQVLRDTTIESLVEYIKSEKCKKIICMVGAGISTSAGIPDFRSPKTGLFCQLAKYNLPFPEAVFDLNFFRSNPKPFYHLARELFPGNFEPTPCHYFMKLLHDKGLLLRLYTQNIDSLERLAGIPSDKLIEAHGTFNTAHCINKRCAKEYSLEWMKKIVLDPSKVDNVPRCEKCDSYVKPDIIFYGEILPDRFYNLIETDFIQCDLLIIMGTSLTVQPFASLVEFVRPNVPRLLINKVKPEGAGSGNDDSNNIDNANSNLFKVLFTKLILGIAGFPTSGQLDFSSNKANNKRNVFMKLETDYAAHRLAEMLEWKEEFEKLLSNNDNNHLID